MRSAGRHRDAWLRVDGCVTGAASLPGAATELRTKPTLDNTDHDAGHADRCRSQEEGHMNVKTILASKGDNVITIEPNTTLEDAIGILAKHRIGALVVLGANQRVIGILSERDIVRVLAERGAAALREPLAAVMTRKVSTCCESDTISSIMEQMTVGKFRHVPVLEQDRLVGIISIGDVVKHRLMEMERESEALRDYIQTA